VRIEDCADNVESAVFYNFSSNLESADWLEPGSDEIPGSILLIKEPYLKYAADNLEPVIYIDSPSG
jgi:hypothetical protein